MRAAIGLAAALALLACAPAPLPERANVLLVTVDTLRPDRLSCYGYRGHETPQICRLAEEGALFEQAFTDTPWTTPSMSSVLTGSYPTRHGFKSTNANRLDPERLTLAEVLRERGYATGAVVGSFPLDAIFQLDQGFEDYDDAFTTPIWRFPDHRPEALESEFRDTPEARRDFMLAKAVNDSRRSDAEVSEAALAWLARRDERPFFLWVHYFGPHSKPDWSVPPSERDRRHLRQYDPDVRENDREVGRLLEALDAQGLRESTLVVFHADHGESLGEQGYLGHGQLLNDATMRVPLLLRMPGVVPAGRRVEALVRNVDIFPTVLELTGGSADLPLSGESLLPLARGEAVPPRSAYMETFYPAHAAFAWKEKLPGGEEIAVGLVRRGIRNQRWKLVRQETHALLDVSAGAQPTPPPALRRRLQSEQLFDLQKSEERDVLDRHPRVAADLRALLEAELAREGGLRVAPIDEESRLRLESLGYGAD